MKRDLELVRKLLLHLEAKEDDRIEECPDIAGHDPLQVQYHLLLMDEAGLLRCEREVSNSTPSRVVKVYPFSLTWEGHEFLSAARNEALWSRAKSIAVKKAGVLSFELVRALLVSLAKSSVGLGSG
jgi:hypothetical protein